MHAVVYYKTTSLVTMLVNPFGLVGIDRLVPRQVTHANSRSWLRDTLKRKLVDFASNWRFLYLPGACLPFSRVNPAQVF